MHLRQGVGGTDPTERRGQRERGSAEHKHRGDDVPRVHRNRLAVRGLLVSGTRNRATLTEPTKLISASAVRPYVTVVSRLKAAHVPIPHIAPATRVSSATSRSSVLGPASKR